MQWELEAIKVLCNAFSWKIYMHPSPHNANNIEPYTFVMLFSGKSDTPTNVTLEWPLTGLSMEKMFS